MSIRTLVTRNQWRWALSEAKKKHKDNKLLIDAATNNGYEN